MGVFDFINGLDKGALYPGFILPVSAVMIIKLFQ